MSKKDLLKKVIHIDGGGITRQKLYSLAENDSEARLLQKIISLGYIELYFTRARAGVNNIDLEYYRVSEKGYMLFEPFYKQAWDFFTTDIAKILSLISIVISILLGLREFNLL